MAALDLTQRAEFESYVYNQEHTVDVLVTLKAARSAEQTTRAQLCLSACIDRSGSMKGAKLDLVKRTLQFVVTQVANTDKMGMVTYDGRVSEAFAMKEMTEEGRQAAEDAVKEVVSGGSTNLSGGLFQSIQQIRCSLEKDYHGNPVPVHAVLLLTDGLANRGITDSAALQRTLEQTLREEPLIKVHTFGYGTRHDGNLLKGIASASQGNYYFIEKEDDVPTYFADALGGLTSVILQNVALKITPAQPNIRIEKVFTGMKMTHDEDANTYRTQSSDLYSEERKDIMVRLKIPALDAPVEADALLNVNLSYFDIPAAECVNTEAIVCVKRLREVLENQVTDQDFLDQRLRIDIADAFEDAAQMLQGGDVCGAQIRIGAERRRLPSHFPSDFCREIKEDLDRCAYLLEHNPDQGASNSMFSRNGSLSGQRSTSSYRTSKQEKMIRKASRCSSESEAPDYNDPF